VSEPSPLQITLPETRRPAEKSIAFVSMHKAGSTVADRICRTIYGHTGMPFIDMAVYAGKHGQDGAKFCVQNAGLIATPGYYFGAFRGLYVREMGDFRANRLIIHIRDPRDCLTSMYYSLGVSHQVPKGEELRKVFLERREHAQQMTVDEFCLWRAPQYVERCTLIRALMNDHPDYLLSKYEDMVERTEGWLQQISDFTGIKLTPELREKIAQYAKFSVSKEEIGRHKRQVTPGDHRRKLKPKTIKQITEELREHLEAFGYTV
jgi:hypothetical protein